MTILQSKFYDVIAPDDYTVRLTAKSVEHAKQKVNDEGLISCPVSSLLAVRVFNNQPCKLTGFKGDYEAFANCFDVDTVQIKSQCGEISILVYRELVKQRFSEVFTPEFYYS